MEYKVYLEGPYQDKELAHYSTELCTDSHIGLLPDLCLFTILKRLDDSQLLALWGGQGTRCLHLQRTLQVVICVVVANKYRTQFLNFDSENHSSATYTHHRPHVHKFDCPCNTDHIQRELYTAHPSLTSQAKRAFACTTKQKLRLAEPLMSCRAWSRKTGMNWE